MAYTTINKSTDYFNTVLWEGNNTSGRQITGVGFEPDLVWIKNRTSSANHGLHTQITGVDGAEYLRTNGTNAITTGANQVPSFDSDGFTINNGLMLNDTSNNYVAWNWLGANASSSNTDGSITSTVSANTTAGFSIVKWTGTGSSGTIGHGLGAEPHVVIVKKLNSSEQWFSYHKPLGNTGALVLNTTAAVVNDAGYWNSTTPTSSVFYVTSNGSNNASGDTYVAYCFAPKTGYSKFDSYVGNGNADGPFVYTGFKPAFVMIKLSTAVDDWQIFDNKRNTFNVMDKYLRPNSSLGTVTNAVIDFTSNGFKLRSSAGSFNPSGGTAIYMAFAQAPLVGTNNIPATAR